MKRRIILQSLETLQKRIEDAYQASEEDPCVDAYAMQKTLIQELIDLLKSNKEAMIDVQLLRWIGRQEYAGKAAAKVLVKEDINALDSILEKECSNRQMSLDDFLEENFQIKKVEIPACENHEGNYRVSVRLKWTCPICGKPRGIIKRVKSYDGSLWMNCDGWDNPCGHVDSYTDVFLEARTNGLNDKKDLLAYITIPRTKEVLKG